MYKLTILYKAATNNYLTVWFNFWKLLEMTITIKVNKVHQKKVAQNCTGTVHE